MTRRRTGWIVAVTTLLLAGARGPAAFAQQPSPPGDEPLTPRERQLLERVEKLEQRLALLEKKAASPAAEGDVPQPDGSTTGAAAGQQVTAPSQNAVPQPGSPDDTGIWRGTSLNFLVDGYYDYNFNQPIGRANQLRAYDVISNAFNLNQADVVIENAPDPSNGKRFGARLDLQFGQATETLQGNPANEPRPDIYRNIFQAYGTYVIPLGTGLTVDVGKFASSLGLEGNYTQDQINYSRSFWFDFLPFYHEGARFKYSFNDVFGVNYWIVNGTQQTEPVNGFKDQYVGLVFVPSKKIEWNVNYYLGQEHPDVVFNPPNAVNPPTLQGVPFEPIRPSATGKLHVLDSYATWHATPKLTVALEGDYVIERLDENSAPDHTIGGAGYFRYQLTPKWAIAGRQEYLSDRGGLFSGATQALKESTATLEYKFTDGFLVRQEWRRDSSNEPFFYTSTLGILKKEQNTATLGMVWWFGRKTGQW